MSLENMPQLSQVESLKAEKATFDKLIMANEAELRDKGILDIAINNIPGFYDEYYPELAQVFVTNVAVADTEAKLNCIPMVPTLRFKLTSTNPKYKYKPIDANVRMEAVNENGELIPTNGFLESEVDVVREMLSFLRQAKKVGQLANMNYFYTSIHDREESKKRHPSNHNK